MLEKNNGWKYKFYQYRSLAQTNSSEQVEKKLNELEDSLNQKIFLSRVDSLNDIFEGCYKFILGKNTGQLIKFVHSSPQFYPEYAMLTPAELESKFKTPDWIMEYFVY